MREGEGGGRGWEGPGGCLRGFFFFLGGGAKYLCSGPKFPPSSPKYIKDTPKIRFRYFGLIFALPS